MKNTFLTLSLLCAITFGETEIDPAQHAAAVELAKAAEVRENIDSGFSNMMPIIEKRAASLGLDAEKKAEFKNIYQDWFNEDVDKDKLVDKTVTLYCKNFTTEELKTLTEFYKTDLGQKFTSILSELNKRTRSFGVQEGQVKQPLLMKRLKPFLEKNAPEALAPPAAAEKPAE